MMSKKRNQPVKEGLTSEKSLFLFEQANERLRFSVDSIDKIKDKSYIAFGVLVTLVTGLAAFLMELIDFQIGFEKLRYPEIVASVYLIFRYLCIANYLKQNLGALTVLPVGNEFKNIWKTVKEGKSFPLIVVAESKSVDKKILKNRAVNRLLSRRLNVALKESLFPPFVALAIFIILSIAKAALCCWTV